MLTSRNTGLRYVTDDRGRCRAAKRSTRAAVHNERAVGGDEQRVADLV
jgi:hypothetical protein